MSTAADTASHLNPASGQCTVFTPESYTCAQRCHGRKIIQQLSGAGSPAGGRWALKKTMPAGREAKGGTVASAAGPCAWDKRTTRYARTSYGAFRSSTVDSAKWAVR